MPVKLPNTHRIMTSVLTFPRAVFREDHEAYRETVRRFIDRECKPRQAEWDTAQANKTAESIMVIVKS